MANQSNVFPAFIRAEYQPNGAFPKMVQDAENASSRKRAGCPASPRFDCFHAVPYRRAFDVARGDPCVNPIAHWLFNRHINIPQKV
jgi:hypothetical protein